jgi:predicted nucleic acid-binding protein
MRYADTCLLISLHLPDPGTPAALAWLEEAGSDPIMASHWSLAEFASGLGIIARRGEIDAATHAATLAQFRRFAADRLIVEPPEAADFERAAGWLERFDTGLRAADALHLAICARRSATLCTADETLAHAADAFGVRAQRVA